MNARCHGAATWPAARRQTRRHDSYGGRAVTCRRHDSSGGRSAFGWQRLAGRPRRCPAAEGTTASRAALTRSTARLRRDQPRLADKPWLFADIFTESARGSQLCWHSASAWSSIRPKARFGVLTARCWQLAWGGSAATRRAVVPPAAAVLEALTAYLISRCSHWNFQNLREMPCVIVIHWYLGAALRLRRWNSMGPWTKLVALRKDCTMLAFSLPNNHESRLVVVSSVFIVSQGTRGGWAAATKTDRSLRYSSSFRSSQTRLTAENESSSIRYRLHAHAWAWEGQWPRKQTDLPVTTTITLLFD